MGRVTCIECGKTWLDQEAFKEDQGCDRGWCLNTEEALMGRRAGRRGNKPPHIDVLELNRPGNKTDEVVEAVVVVGERKRVKMQVHATTSQVLSRNIHAAGQHEITVSDAININIFVRR